LRELIADLFISLDGFASGVNEAAFFGYYGAELGKWIAEHLEEDQVLVMGRVTYEALAQFAASGTDAVNMRMTELPKLVFSSKLAEPLAWKNTRVSRSRIEEEIKTLKQQNAAPLRTIGSVSLVKSMMQLGLVDRLRLMVFPVILGRAGREPIFTDYLRTSLELIASKTLDSRLLALEFRPK
jgi:dihydrofolate reductase